MEIPETKPKQELNKLHLTLSKLYAQRKSAKGLPLFTKTDICRNELEASFIYEDTRIRKKATMDVKADMQADTVMDRLICGDVGFGKTEVCYPCCLQSCCRRKQVALLVPTTILAFQHYRSFKRNLKTSL